MRKSSRFYLTSVLLSMSLMLPRAAAAEWVLVEFSAPGGRSLVASGDASSGPASWNTEAASKRVQARARAIAAARDDLIASLAPDLAAALMGDYDNFPLLRMDVDVAQRQALLLHPQVTAVYDDRLQEAVTASSLAYIGAWIWHQEGITGEDTAVAILDTGIRYWNGFFGICEQPGDPECRVKVFEGFATLQRGTGTTDPIEVANISGHGTNVGGIVGDVAPGTDLLSLGVFAYYDADPETGAQPGVFTNDGDVAEALDWSITHRDEYNIVAANLSLGSSPDPNATGYCTGWMAGAYLTAFANSRDAGIIPAVATGNDYVKTAVAPPSCAVPAFRIGAGYDDPAFGYSCGTGPVVPGSVVCFSNSSSLVDVIAPGNDIDAGGLYGYSGTSMATPHAAGLVAVYSSLYGIDPVWTIERIRADAVPVVETGPQQTFIHRYVRMGDHDAVLSFSAGAVLLSDFVGLPIPDGSDEGVEVTAEVECEAESCFSDSVGNVYLDLNVEHPGTGDLVIELEAPDGTAALREIDGDDELGLNNVNSILGSQHLEGAFDDLKAAPISGTWTLRLYDDTAGREGTLYRAVLLLDPARLEIEAGLEAPEVARPDEPFDVGVTIENRGNLNVTGVDLELELINVESGEVVRSEPLDIELPMRPGDVQSMLRAMDGPQGNFRLRLRAAGVEPDVPPGFHCDPVEISITYRTFASFEVDPTVPSPGQEARMVVLSRGLVDAWQWDFGDGTASTTPEPFHIWHEPGQYVVSLTVSGPDGVSTTARRVSVETQRDTGVDALGGCGCVLPGTEPSRPDAPPLALLLSLILLAAGAFSLRRLESGSLPRGGRMEVASPPSGISARNDSCGDGPSSLSLRGGEPLKAEAISMPCMPRWMPLAALAAAVLMLAGCDGDGGPADADTDEAPPSTGPWISLLDPDDPSRGTFPVYVMLSSDDASTCDVTLRYRVDQGEFQPLTLANGEDTVGAASSPEGVEHTLEWLSAADVPDDVGNVQLRAEATCGGAASLPVYSRRFMLLNFFESRPHAVLIAEVSTADANLPADVQTDYVELVNTTDEAIDLYGWTLMLWSTGAARIDHEFRGTIIEAGDRILIAGPESGLQAQVELAEDIGWDVVRGGAVALVADFGRGVDFIRWGGSSALPPEDLNWIEDPPLPIPQTTTVLLRADERNDTDRASDFCMGRPTPAAASSGCIDRTLPGDVLITELSTQGTDDEVEVLNLSGSSVDLGGWVILWNGDEFGEGRISLASFFLEDGSRLVLRDNGEAGTVRSGVMELGENLNIDGLVPIALALQNPYGDVVDFLAAGGSLVRWMEWTEEHPTPMPGPLTTLSRLPGNPDTDSSADFCLTESNMGQAPEACLEPMGITLRITEVMPGRPDWIEIFNPGPEAVDLRNVYFSYTTPFSRSGNYTVDDYRLSGTIEAGAFAVASERDIAGVTVIPVDRNIWLGSDGDASVALRDVYGFGIDYVSWGEPAGMPLWPDVWLGLGADIYETDEDQISLERYPHDAEDTDGRDDWCWAPPSPANPNSPCE